MKTEKIQMGNLSLDLSLTTLSSNEQKKTIKELEKIENKYNQFSYKPLSLEEGLLKDNLEYQNYEREKENFENIREKSLEMKANLLYPQIQDFSFLSWSNKLNYKNQEISVPKFGVYPLNKNSFSIEIEESFSLAETIGLSLAYGVCGAFAGGMTGAIISKEGAGIGAIIGGISATAGLYLTGKSLEGKRVKFPDTPKILNDQLIKTIEFSQYADGGEGGLWGYFFKRKDIPKELYKKYNKIGNIELKSDLNCLIPTETRERIKKAKEIFRQNIYFIAETKPEEWNIQKFVSKDPLVVGVAGNKGFFIDRFDPTDLESYVYNNFRSYNINSEN